METTFMTIHNLTLEANILFASESIADILGYQSFEVIGRSCFDYFHPNDVPFARYGHNQNLRLDKAAVLYYARIRAKNDEWVSCECVFTVVHDVLVSCTSIYRGDLKSYQRDVEVKKVNRLFSSPPRDPRYHMLDHLSSKFTTAPQANFGEPRAALILNRFSRTLSIMYATNAVSGILGVTADEIHGKSFYECIQENCLPDAIRCLEGAKANDSIAYLRFFYRDPRRHGDLEQPDREASQSSDSEDGGVQLDGYPGDDGDVPMEGVEQNVSGADQNSSFTSIAQTNSRTDLEHDSSNLMSYRQPPAQSHSSSSSGGHRSRAGQGSGDHQTQRSNSASAEQFEIEAVISCTSDGLVVILRKAPVIQPIREPEYSNGYFAAPWAAEPILPRYSHSPPSDAQGPSENDFMNSIREVAVFAWSLTGINGNIASYSHGTPRGEAVPPTGYPIWLPRAEGTEDLGPENQAMRRWAELGKTSTPPHGNQIPYQYPREEGLLKTSEAYGNGTIDTVEHQKDMFEQRGVTANQPPPPNFQQEYTLLTAPSIEQNYVKNPGSAPNGTHGQDSVENGHSMRNMWF